MDRFGETAANTGTLVLLNNHESAKHLDIGIKTSIAMSIASLWRVIIMPIDTCKNLEFAHLTYNPPDVSISHHL